MVLQGATSWEVPAEMDGSEVDVFFGMKWMIWDASEIFGGIPWGSGGTKMT